MHQNNDFKIWASLIALVFASQACTVVTENGGGSKDSGGVDRTRADAGGDESSDADSSRGSRDGDAGANPGSGDSGSSDDDTSDDPDDEDDVGTDAGADPDDGDSGAGDEPGEGSDEYTLSFPDWSCGSRDVGDLEPVPQDIQEDTTWSGTVYINNAVRVRDAVLTIEPGTRVLMGADARLIVGYLGAGSRIDAQGTAEDPVRFCGTDSDAGFWDGIVVEDNVVSSSRFANVLIDGAGTDNAALDLQARLRVQGVLVRNGRGSGVRAADFHADSGGLFVTGNEGQAVELTSGNAVMRFPEGGNLSGNGRDAVLLDFRDVTGPVTFRNLRVPYLFKGSSLRIRDSAEVVFEAGTEVEMGVDSQIIAGYLGSSVTIEAQGEKDNPVTFRAEVDESAFWHGILLEGSVRSSTHFEHVNVIGAGADDHPAFEVRSPVRLKHLTLEDSGRGMVIAAKGVHADSDRWTIRRTDGAPIEVDVDALTTLPARVSFADNEREMVQVTGRDLSTSGTIRDLGIPYRVDNTIRVRDDAEIVVEPGTEFRMGADTSIEIGYLSSTPAFVAKGTQEAPIRFVGMDAEPGRWKAIVVHTGARGTSAFDWVEIGHAGADYPAALVLNRAVEVTNTTVFASASAGIAKSEADATDYTESNSFMDIQGDDVVDL